MQKKQQQQITNIFCCKTPKLKTTMQKSITNTFEFFEFMHLIVNDSDSLLIKLWLIGNKEIQYWMQECLKSLILYKLFKKKENMLQVFKNIEYLQIIFFPFYYEDMQLIIKHIPKFVKFLDIECFEIKDSDIDVLPKTLTYLKTNAQKFKNPNLPQNLTILILFDCQNLTIDFINNLPYKITTLKLNKLRIVNFELKHLENLVSLELKFGKIQTFVLENCLDLKTLSLHGNQLVEFPQSILKLMNLESLNLCYNNIFQIPENFSQLQNLKYLNFGSNELTEFSTVLLQLVNLETLCLHSNTILKVFILDSKLQNLIKLDLSNNNIDEIHLQLPKLQYLDLNNNKIIEIHLQTLKLQKLHHDDNANICYHTTKLTKVFIN